MNKRYRLKKNYEFNYVYKKGKSNASKEFVLISLKGFDRNKEQTNAEKIYVGFSVPKKIGKAVKRNKAKRWIKEAFHHFYAKGMLKGCYRHIVVARVGIFDSTFEQIKRSLKYVLKKNDALN